MILSMTLSAWSVEDPHSYAKPDQVAVKHLDLKLSVDFKDRQLAGTATWDLMRSPGSKEVIFDTRDLTIRSVTSPDGKALKYTLGKSDPLFGTPLAVALPPGIQQVVISYITSPEAAALQWLEPAQTAGGEHPFLFTQSQAILARSWIPCQDGPGVRFTYKAEVSVPPGFLALMSATNPTKLDDKGTYSFSMPQAIPSYLMALAVGDIGFQSLGEVTGIYAEPVSLKAAAYEFEETEKMVRAVEKMFGPYRWGRYDMLVLPPSFPFGGMENPRLTFLTPTVIAGDRSLTSLIAHELAHSWSGNLVTNSTWNDFWLNEGFTVYLERRIMEELYGLDYAQMLSSLGFDDLEKTLAETPSSDTHLKLNLKGRDPDEGLSDVAYEKGYFFLTSLEKEVGRKRFDRFLRGYFDKNAFSSRDTESFLAAVNKELGGDLDVRSWVYEPGLPDDFEPPKSERFDQVDAQLEAWKSGAAPKDLVTQSWTTHEWLRFLRGLPDTITTVQMVELDEAYGFTKSGNSEILAQWLGTAIATDYEVAYPTLQDFLTKVGRRKFLEPLYKELVKTPDGLVLARTIYTGARGNYHSVAVGTIDAIVGWQDRANW